MTKTPEDVGRILDVSRETLDRLQVYVDTLIKWQNSINLVGPKTIDDIWERHILDSGQIFSLTGDSESQIMDIGSGAGLPGLVIAIMRHGIWGDDAVPVTMVESDERKCAFLGVAAQKAGIKIKIKNDRLEKIPSLYPDVITARALASIETLYDWTIKQQHEDLKCVFLKGAQVDEELTYLKEKPNIIIDKHPSLTSGDGVIIHLSGFTKN